MKHILKMLIAVMIILSVLIQIEVAQSLQISGNGQQNLAATFFPLDNPLIADSACNLGIEPITTANPRILNLDNAPSYPSGCPAGGGVPISQPSGLPSSGITAVILNVQATNESRSNTAELLMSRDGTLSDNSPNLNPSIIALSSYSLTIAANSTNSTEQTVSVSAAGKVQLGAYLFNNDTSEINLQITVAGYYSDNPAILSSSSTYYPVNPAQIANSNCPSPSGFNELTPGNPTDSLTVTNSTSLSSNCTNGSTVVPNSASAVTLEVTANSPGSQTSPTLWVASQSNELTGIDTINNSVVAQWGSSSNINAPVQIAVTPDGSTAVVTQSGGILDVITNAATTTPVLNQVTMPTSCSSCTPYAIVFASDGQGFVSNNITGTGQVFPFTVNETTGTIIFSNPISVGSNPMSLSVTPDNATLLVADNSSNNILPIALEPNSFVASEVNCSSYPCVGNPIGSGSIFSNLTSIASNTDTAYALNAADDAVIPIILVSNSDCATAPCIQPPINIGPIGNQSLTTPLTIAINGNIGYIGSDIPGDALTEINLTDNTVNYDSWINGADSNGTVGQVIAPSGSSSIYVTESSTCTNCSAIGEVSQFSASHGVSVTDYTPNSGTLPSGPATGIGFADPVGTLNIYSYGSNELSNSQDITFREGQTLTSQVTLGLGSSGEISFSSDLLDLNLEVDVLGYYQMNTAGYSYISLDPVRLADSTCPVPSGFNSLIYGNSAVLSLDSASSYTGTTCSNVQLSGLPASGIQAAILQVTASTSSSTQGGSVTIYSSGPTKPDTENISFPASGSAILQTSNESVVMPNSNSSLTFAANLLSTDSTSINLQVDLAGYFVTTPPVSNYGYNFTPIVPTSSNPGTTIADSTCSGSNYKELASPNTTDTVTVDGSSFENNCSVESAGLPASGIAAVVVNATAIVPAGSYAGSLTLWPSDLSSEPLATSLSFPTNATTSTESFSAVSTIDMDLNMNTNNSINVELNKVASDGTNNPGPVNFRIDVQGYYSSGSSQSYVPINPIQIANSKCQSPSNFLSLSNSPNETISMNSPLSLSSGCVGDSAFSSFSSDVYVTDPASSDVYAMNTNMNTKTNSIDFVEKVGNDPQGIALKPGVFFTPDTLFVTNSQDATVSVLDAGKQASEYFVSLDQSTNSPIDPTGIVYSGDATGDTNTIYVVDSGSNMISVLTYNSTSGQFQTTGTITGVGSDPASIAIDPQSSANTDTLFVTSSKTNQVIEIPVNPSSPPTSCSTVCQTISVGTDPVSVAYSPKTGLIYSANQGSNNISVISQVSSNYQVTSTLSGFGNSPSKLSLIPGGSNQNPSNTQDLIYVSSLDASSNSQVAVLAINTSNLVTNSNCSNFTCSFVQDIGGLSSIAANTSSASTNNAVYATNLANATLDTVAQNSSNAYNLVTSVNILSPNTKPSGLSSSDTAFVLDVTGTSSTNTADSGYIYVNNGNSTEADIYVLSGQSTTNQVVTTTNTNNQLVVGYVGTGSVNVSVDVVGYYVSSGGDLYMPVDPQRIADSSCGFSGASLPSSFLPLITGRPVALNPSTSPVLSQSQTCQTVGNSNTESIPSSDVAAVVGSITALNNDNNPSCFDLNYAGVVHVYSGMNTTPSVAISYGSDSIVTNQLTAINYKDGTITFSNEQDQASLLNKPCGIGIQFDALGYYLGSNKSITELIGGGNQNVASTSSNGDFMPVNSTLICDTRNNGNATPCLNETLTSSTGGTFTPAIQVAGQGPIPSTGATAVQLIVTAISYGTTVPGSLTVYQAGTAEPNVQNINYQSSESVSSQIVVGLSSVGQISISATAGPIDVTVSVDGYYGTNLPYSYTPLPPVKIADSSCNMPSSFQSLGGSSQPSLDTLNIEQAYPIGASNNGICPVVGNNGLPSLGVAAVELTVTVNEPSGGAAGDLVLYQAGLTEPTNAPSIYFEPGQLITGYVTVNLNSQYLIDIADSASTGSLNLSIGVVGFYGPNSYYNSGYTSVAPYSIADSTCNDPATGQTYTGESPLYAMPPGMPYYNNNFSYSPEPSDYKVPTFGPLNDDLTASGNTYPYHTGATDQLDVNIPNALNNSTSPTCNYSAPNTILPNMYAAILNVTAIVNNSSCKNKQPPGCFGGSLSVTAGGTSTADASLSYFTSGSFSAPANNSFTTQIITPVTTDNEIAITSNDSTGNDIVNIQVSLAGYFPLQDTPTPTPQTGNSVSLNHPNGITQDSFGNTFVSDTANNKIDELNKGGIVTTVAGTGTPGYSGDNGSAVAAELNNPQGLAIDSRGDLIIADSNNNRIRLVTNSTCSTGCPYGLSSLTQGDIYTVAGTGTAGYGGDNGSALNAELNDPQSVAVNSSNNLVISDTGNYRIRMDSGGTITTVAGNGIDPVGSLSLDGIATDVGVDPGQLYFNQSGDLLISDPASKIIRQITQLVSETPMNSQSQITPPKTLTSISSISCPTYSICLATGDLGITPTVMLTTDFGSSWISESLGGNNLGLNNIELNSISCSSTNTCTIAANNFGTAETGVIYTTNNANSTNATWLETIPSGVNSLSGVSCPSVNTCVAVGSNATGGTAIAYNGTAWVSMGTLGTSPFNTVSCSTSTSCEAAGQDIYSIDYTSGSWTGTLQNTPITLVNSLSCPGTTDCYGVGTNTGSPAIIYTTNSGSTWSTYSSIPSTLSTVSSIDCTSVTVCIAGGTYQNKATFIVDATADNGNSSTWSAVNSPSSITDITTFQCLVNSSYLCMAAGIGTTGNSVISTTFNSGINWSIPSSASSNQSNFANYTAEQNAFSQYGNSDLGYLGGQENWIESDGGYPVSLPNGQIGWFYGDSAIGQVNQSNNEEMSTIYLHNQFVIQSSKNSPVMQNMYVTSIRPGSYCSSSDYGINSEYFEPCTVNSKDNNGNTISYFWGGAAVASFVNGNSYVQISLTAELSNTSGSDYYLGTINLNSPQLEAGIAQVNDPSSGVLGDLSGIYVKTQNCGTVDVSTDTTDSNTATNIDANLISSFLTTGSNSQYGTTYVYGLVSCINNESYFNYSFIARFYTTSFNTPGGSGGPSDPCTSSQSYDWSFMTKPPENGNPAVFTCYNQITSTLPAVPLATSYQQPDGTSQLQGQLDGGSVTQVGSTFRMVGQVDSRGPIEILTAPSPEGPFKIVQSFNPPELMNPDLINSSTSTSPALNAAASAYSQFSSCKLWTYLAHELPELETGSNIVLSYSINTNGQCNGFFGSTINADNYRIRFVELNSYGT